MLRYFIITMASILMTLNVSLGNGWTEDIILENKMTKQTSVISFKLADLVYSEYPGVKKEFSMGLRCEVETGDMMIQVVGATINTYTGEMTKLPILKLEGFITNKDTPKDNIFILDKPLLASGIMSYLIFDNKYQGMDYMLDVDYFFNNIEESGKEFGFKVHTILGVEKFYFYSLEGITETEAWKMCNND